MVGRWGAIFVLALALAGPAAASPTFEAAPEVDREMTRLSANVNRLEDKLKALHGRLVHLRAVMALPSRMAGELGQLSRQFQRNKRLLETARQVPRLEDDAERLIEAIRILSNPSKQARKDLSRLNDKVAKAEAALKIFHEDVWAARDKLEEFQFSFMSAYAPTVGGAQACVDGVPKRLDGVRVCLQSKLNAFARSSSGRLKRLNRALGKAIGTVDAIGDYIDGTAAPAFATLAPVADGIEAADNRLAGLNDPLRRVGSAMNATFTVYFPYAKAVTLRESSAFGDLTTATVAPAHYPLRMDSGTIVKGRRAVEAEIEKTLDGAMLEAARDYGLGVLAGELENRARNELDGAVAGLDLDVEVAIDGLKSVGGRAKRIGKVAAELRKRLAFPSLKLESRTNALYSDMDRVAPLVCGDAAVNACRP